ncbi:hypothetical protein HN371_18460 [Candidatus Poribacteria bacterium]|jgi:hypothetical protein|nr:hypothetical protein [Candidatus Poribacteria bacterium]MBT5534715.1 hypothetical protein [Candidatus Poribacteria bacterium]MBT5715265.1 hypothetical protein [Candidatus Poribacteria bacterium]MBT7098638.1 hypothetical protein [Candidatus Poribacteria bacterium]MBT7809056.1 hypothetical protein [Candidatus Poribacteria bacterium]
MPAVRQLPPTPSLEHLRNEAKALLKAYHANDADAAARLDRHPRAGDGTKDEMQLADAQHVLALEYGFHTWRALKDYVASDRAAVEAAVLGGDAEALDRIVAADPGWRRRREHWRGYPRYGEAPELLTYAAVCGSVALVDVLLAHGSQSQVDMPAVFFHCLRTGRFHAADHLLEQCDVEIHHLQEHLYQLTEDLNVGGVRWLIENGANPDYRRAGTKWTPLHNGIHTYPCLNPNRQQVARILVEAGANHDDNALYDLLTGRLDRLTERLDTDPSLVHAHFDLRGGRDTDLEFGAIYGGAPLADTTLLHHCAEYGWTEEARFLLERGADPNARAMPAPDGFNTHTAMFHAVTTNCNVSWDVLTLLVESGADVNARANVRVGEELRDVTPLGYIDRFPNGYHKSDTPGDWGATRDLGPAAHPEVVELLRQHGAN